MLTAIVNFKPLHSLKVKIQFMNQNKPEYHVNYKVLL